MDIKIGCRYCVAERVHQIYGLRVSPQEASALLGYALKPGLKHPRDLRLENLRDPLTQEFLFYTVINKTQFFRDMYMMGMVEKVLKDVLERKLTDQTIRPKIKIWSVGCSRGQEPYSIAMLIRKNGWHTRADFEILGTDIVARFLGAATKGKDYIVDDWERPINYLGEREIPTEYLPLVVSRADLVDMRPEVRAMVKFRVANLLDSEDYRDREGIDLILVNNVFYYFEKDDTKKALRLLTPTLSPGGVVISKDLSDELTSESGVPLRRIRFDDYLELTVNGEKRAFENRQGYRAYQKI